MNILRTDPPRMQSIISDAHLLFTGRAVSDWDDASASAHSGICVFSKCLYDFSDTFNEHFLLHVIPGGIEHKSKPYQCVRDRKPYSNKDFPSLYKPGLDSYDAVSLLVTPAFDSLKIEYEVQSKIFPPVRIGPTIFAEMILGAKRPSQCSNLGCRPFEVYREDVVSSTHRRIDFAGKKIDIIYGSTIQRALAVALFGAISMCPTILGANACLSCSLRLAIKLDRNGILLVREVQKTRLEE